MNFFSIYLSLLCSLVTSFLLSRLLTRIRRLLFHWTTSICIVNFIIKNKKNINVVWLSISGFKMKATLSQFWPLTYLYVLFRKKSMKNYFSNFNHQVFSRKCRVYTWLPIAMKECTIDCSWCQSVLYHFFYKNLCPWIKKWASK